MTEENKLMAQRCIFAHWREGVVRHRHLPLLTLRWAMFALASAVAVWGTDAEASIPLTVKCRCERADADRDIAGKADILWNLVLYYSGSTCNHEVNDSDGWNSYCIVRYGRVGNSECCLDSGNVSGSGSSTAR